MTNLQLLIQKYQTVTLDMTQLGEVLHMKTKSVLNAARAGRLPVHTYKAGGHRLVNIKDVAEYLDGQSNWSPTPPRTPW